MSYHFQGQRSNEEIVLLAKQHPVVLLHPMITSVLILLIPFVFNIFFNFSGLTAVLLIISLLLAAVHGGFAWYSWVNSIMLLTNERVVVLRQVNFFNREFAECNLASLQQVSHKVKGLLRTVFGFGNITIYIGGSQTPFLISEVPEPYDIQQEILRAASGE